MSSEKIKNISSMISPLNSVLLKRDSNL